jgi:TRAP-type C4-dicarboxylate transport system permease small subunit
VAYQWVFKQAKRKAMLVYLKTLQAVRRSLIAAICVFFALQFIVFSFFGAVISGIWLLPVSDVSTKLYILLGFFALIFFIYTAGLCVLLSERQWFKLSGAEKILQDS